MTTKSEVIELLGRYGPLAPSEVATRLALGYERIKKAMQRMARAGDLTVAHGRYSVTQRDTSTRHGDMHRVRVRVAERNEWENSPSTLWIA